MNRQIFSYECLTLRLSTGAGPSERVPAASGLNWGQRPGRNHDQAYLALPADVQRSDFFPKPGVEFSITTDDSETWICARRQANGKAIHTIKDNAILGWYFRKRLGLPSGDLITLAHLLRYGRTSVDIYKEDMTCYHIDFRALNGHIEGYQR